MGAELCLAHDMGGVEAYGGPLLVDMQPYGCFITPVDHVEPVEQGSMAPPVVISTDNLIDFQMSLDPNHLVPNEESIDSTQNKTH